MFTDYKNAILKEFGCTLEGLVHRGMTVQEAFSIIASTPNKIEENDITANSCEYFLKGSLHHWLLNNRHSSLEDLIGASLMEQIATLESNTTAAKSELFTIDELQDAIDQPGFCWDNLSDAEQRNLYSSLDAFVHEQISKLNKKVETLFESIKQGDEDHQNWLQEAIKAHFDGSPIPEYNAAKSTEIKIDLAEGEPVFILKGRDPQAPALIEDWADMRALCDPMSAKPSTAYAIARDMREFKTANPELGMSRAIYRDTNRRDIPKLRAWTESLKKGALLCSENHHRGDAATIDEIITHLAENESAQPRLIRK